MLVTFGGYTIHCDTLRKGQMILAQAKREMRDGDVDRWYYAGCPTGKAYAKWSASLGSPAPR